MGCHLSIFFFWQVCECLLQINTRSHSDADVKWNHNKMWSTDILPLANNDGVRSVCGFQSQRQAGSRGFSSKPTPHSNPRQRTFVQTRTSACALPTPTISTQTRALFLLPTCMPPRDTNTLKSSPTPSQHGCHSGLTCSQARKLCMPIPTPLTMTHGEAVEVGVPSCSVSKDTHGPPKTTAAPMQPCTAAPSQDLGVTQ